MTPYYQDSLVTIYHGDCFEVLPQIRPEVDLLLTDPPYGLRERLAGGGWGCSQPNGWEWDQAAPEITGLLAYGTDQIVWGGQYFFGLPPNRCWLAWVKPDAVRTMAPFELAWTNLDKPAQMFTMPIAAVNGERNGHPTLKPLRLMSWCIELADGPTSVLDPFMGSGTTLRAAKDRNMRAIGIEAEERYCEIAAERCRQEVLELGA